MTQFGPSIKPIAFPTQSGCTTCYATHAGMSPVHLIIEEKFCKSSKVNHEKDKQAIKGKYSIKKLSFNI